jgi:hypothetical protein
MNDLEEYFYQNKGRLISKWDHYFEVYDKHFQQYRNKEVTILEIGVFHGGSLQMWKSYFGDKAKIYGIDINPKCKDLEEDNIKIFIGSQSDKAFLRNVKAQIPKVDILIDDGGHTMKQQIVSFKELFDHIKEDGIYLCEDIHTSYWLRFGGGYRRRGTFIEFSKRFVDYLNAYHSNQRSLKVNEFTKSVNSLHFYDSMLVIEKKKREKSPVQLSSGNLSYESTSTKKNLANFLYTSSKKYINIILRFFRLKGCSWN